MVNLSDYYKYQFAVENLKFPTISYEALPIVEAKGLKAKKLDFLGNANDSVNKGYGFITNVKNIFGNYTDEQANSIKVTSRAVVIVKNSKTNQREDWRINTVINNLGIYPDPKFYNLVYNSIYLTDEYEVDDLEFKRATFKALKQASKDDPKYRNFSTGFCTLLDYLEKHDQLPVFDYLSRQDKAFFNVCINIISVLYEEYKGKPITSITSNR